MRSFVLFALLLALCSFVHSGTVSQWKSRTIYQLLTDRFARTDGSNQPCANLGDYCGGTFQGIINHLDYIQDMGFDAIWISPVVTNTPGGYHGYWMQDMYTINAHFGSAQDLQNLINACHARNIWVMVDVVANHVGPVGYDYSTINPFNLTQYYHSCDSCPAYCTIQNYQCFTNEIEICRTSGLPDLNQTNTFVYNSLINWISDFVKQYDVDGLRYDTVPEIDPSFWADYQQAAGVYGVGEVFTGDMSCVGKYSYAIDGVLSYPMYFTIKNVFQSKQSMSQFTSTINSYNQNIEDVAAAGTFSDNHDNARFLWNFNDLIAYKSALVYVIMSQGIPIIYYGTEQAFNGGPDPNNREVLWTTNYNNNTELYQFVKLLVNYRKQAQLWNYAQQERYAYVDNFYAFSRGTTFVALTNQKNNIMYSCCSTPYSEGQKVCNLFYPTDCVVVTNGCLPVYLNNGESKIFYPV